MSADPVSGIPYPLRSVAPDITATMQPAIDAIGLKLGHLCSLRKVTAQSIPNAVGTAVTWDTVISDGWTMHTGSAATITIPVDGVYDIAAQVAFPPMTSGMAYGQILVGAVTYECATMPALGVSYGVIVPIVAAGVVATAGQTVTVQIFQASGGALSIGASDYNNRVSVSRAS